MSTVKTERFLQEGVWQVEWALVGTGESGDPADISKWVNKTVHISGTVGAGGTVTIQGSHDGTNWAPLSSGLSTQGDLNAIVIPGANVSAMRVIYENARYIRPVVAGTGSSAKIIIVAT